MTNHTPEFSLKRCAAFLLGLAILVIPWQVAPMFMGPQSEEDFWLILPDKARLLQRTEGRPRILMAGGSNVLFGIDSQLIEQVSGQTVVNLGLIGTLGLRFILWYSERYAKPGDTIVLSLEYMALEPDFGTLAETAFRYKETYVFVSDELSLLNKTRFYLQSGQKSAQRLFSFLTSQTVKNQIYRRDAINSNGDLVSHLQPGMKMPVHTLRMGGPAPCAVEQDFVDLVNQFTARQRAKGIDVFFSYPTLCQSYFEDHGPKIREAQKMLEDPVSGLHCSILDRPSTFVYPDAMYFDSIYHLNGEGRKQRSNTLGQELTQAKWAMKERLKP